MQEQMNDRNYKEPESLDQDKLVKRLQDQTVRRIIVFRAKDSSGSPTLEMRRAWRRVGKRL